jgi:hypothetical protein
MDLTPILKGNDEGIISYLSSLPKLPPSLIIVDVSGSMELPCGNSSRLEVASLLAVELTERAACSVWATAGSDVEQKHRTHKASYRGHMLCRFLKRACLDLGGGGMFLSQAIKHISHYEPKPERLIVITDTQVSVPTFFRKVFTLIDLSKIDHKGARNSL